MYANYPVPGSSWRGRSAAVPVRIFIISNQIQYKWSVPPPLAVPAPGPPVNPSPCSQLVRKPYLFEYIVTCGPGTYLITTSPGESVSNSVLMVTFGVRSDSCTAVPFTSIILSIYNKSNSATTRTQRSLVLMRARSP